MNVKLQFIGLTLVGLFLCFLCKVIQTGSLFLYSINDYKGRGANAF